MTTTIKHPAKYSDALLPVLAEALAPCRYVLDPMGGTGKLVGIRDHGWHGVIYVNEIEPEWARLAKLAGADYVTVGDAANLPYADGSMDAACWSPVYGNKMSEHADWKDGSKRLTYKAYLGRALHERNAGRFYFGTHGYADIHWRAYTKLVRVIRPGGRAVCNVKDFIRGGEVVSVSEWHRSVLEHLGFVLVDRLQVEVTGARFGANHDKRLDHENVFVFERGRRC